MQPTQLSETCPLCGAVIFVVQEFQPSMLVPGRQVMVPVTAPVCANGHDWHAPHNNG